MVLCITVRVEILNRTGTAPANATYLVFRITACMFTLYSYLFLVSHPSAATILATTGAAAITLGLYWSTNRRPKQSSWAAKALAALLRRKPSAPSSSAERHTTPHPAR